MKRAFKVVASVALAGAVLGATPVAAQVAQAPTREEIQRQSLDDRLRQETPGVGLTDSVERAPCPLADPQFADLRFVFTGVDFSGLDGIDRSLVESSYAEFLNQELPVSAICEIRDRVATSLRRAQFLAAVQVPAQEIEDGRVELNVVIARISTAQVRGEPGPSGDALEGYIEKISGQDLFNIDEVERYLLLARDIPGLDVRLTLQSLSAATQAGQVVGVFDVQRTPVEADISIQNFGSKSVGRFGALGRVAFNGLTGLRDVTRLSFFVSEDPEEQQVVQVGHQFGVGSEGLTLGGDFTYAWTQPDIANTDPDPFESESLVVSAYAAYPFVRSQSLDLFGTIGFDLVDQDVDFAGLPFTEESLRVVYGRLAFNALDEGSIYGTGGYSGVEPRWAVAGAIELRQGIGFLGASERCGVTFANCTAPGIVPPARLDGDPTAFVLRAEGRLEYRPIPELAFVLSPRLQYSPDALFSYEQISGGNFTIGRGFDPGAAIGDSGYGGQIEVAYGSIVPQTPDAIAVQTFAFFDLLAVSTKNVTGDPQTISSVGGGIRATIGSRASLDVFGAVPLERAPFQASRGDFRLLMSLTVRLAPWNP